MMNKTTNGRSALLALLLLCLSLFILTVPKAADASGIGNARVIDEMNLLSDAEVQNSMRSSRQWNGHTASASSRQSSVIGKTNR